MRLMDNRAFCSLHVHHACGKKNSAGFIRANKTKPWTIATIAIAESKAIAVLRISRRRLINWKFREWKKSCLKIH